MLSLHLKYLPGTKHFIIYFISIISFNSQNNPTGEDREI